MIRGFLDLSRIVRLLPIVEVGRRRRGPAPLVDSLRSRGARAIPRTEAEQVRLRLLIRWVDRLMPGEPNCYRRALLEIGLDSAAAQAPLHFGLRHGGGLRSGHAWLGSTREPFERYDAEFTT